MEEAEINLAIAKLEYPDAERKLDSAFIRALRIDYVNNWQDIGQIIEREGIPLKPLVNGWEAGGYHLGCKAEAQTPTKAAALCYLKMNGV